MTTPSSGSAVERGQSSLNFIERAHYQVTNMHFAAVLVLAAAWPQFGRDATHTGAAPNVGQPLQVVAASVVMDRDTGQIIDRFGGPPPLDSFTFVCGPIVADAAGSLYYNVIALARTLPWNTDVRDAWITRITPHFAVSMGHFSNLIAQAPSG